MCKSYYCLVHLHNTQECHYQCNSTNVIVTVIVGEQRMAQWWEHSPPTNVAQVQILVLTPYVGWDCCWFSPLLREVFLRVLRFSLLLKNQNFQIPIIQSGIWRTKNHFVDVLPPNHHHHHHHHYYYYYYILASHFDWQSINFILSSESTLDWSPQRWPQLISLSSQ